ncbi:Low-affinity potassium transport protein [Fusarium oxysporum f. sp. narcissi]|uniref:Low-affinity potassium transport protein n=1 Tax=Fusarium oxysporum f. sp. narcissi TaxID=451672 RepID=A0A4Q2V119_FUSOX|nr:Low-affinity potassium transport protein [Fusarium oxysporum f. sp. narcissi]
MSLLALPILAPYGNISATDAYFFGASASTESGLNTVDVKELKTYQQLYLYFIPIITNLGFINITVVVVRLYWFKRHLKRLAPQLLSPRRRDASDADVEEGKDAQEKVNNDLPVATAPSNNLEQLPSGNTPVPRTTTITFDPSVDQRGDSTTLYIPGPQERDRDHIVSTSTAASGEPGPSVRRRRPRRISTGDGFQMTAARSMDRVAGVASSLLMMGSETTRPRRQSTTSVSQQQPALNDRPFLSRQATIGRNSEFHNLTSHDRELLGGIEYRSLKLLLKIVIAYFFGIHLFGAICLVGWIQTANPKYREYLQSTGQDKNWWAFYSAQTMVDNLGFTLTPDSMISFRDAKWPMILMSFLAFAGNTLYPVFLRLVIWTMSKLLSKHSSTQEPLAFLLNYPRRCYTLLFPSKPTWILFGIIFSLNFIDVLLIIVLDLDNPEVASLPLDSRIPAAIFQAASARHTGTATFNLANVNPGVQLSLLVMMYIAVFPIALSIRLSNTYEEKSLGIWEPETSLNERNGKSYLMQHIKNQLGFDLWYIFLGTFCICVAEATRIADVKDPAFTIFSVLFEVTSAYGNVGLSLGYPTVSTSLCGKFGTFGKVVICLTMIRGRHRGLPYALDRAVMLPDEHLLETPADSTE